MNVADMIALLNEHGFEDIEEVRKVEAINDAVGDICSREPWPFLEATGTATIASDGKVTVASNEIQSILSIVDTTSGQILAWKRWDEFAKNYANSMSLTGNPYLYFFKGNGLYIYPINQAATLQVNYLKVHPVLTAGSAESAILLPPRHHRAIVYAALVSLYAQEDDPEQAQMFKARLDERLVTMRQDLFKLQWDRPDNILVVDEDDWYC